MRHGILRRDKNPETGKFIIKEVFLFRVLEVTTGLLAYMPGMQVSPNSTSDYNSIKKCFRQLITKST